jgi:hypothetical protein
MNFNDGLHGHVSLEIDCVDRVLLDACVSNLGVGGGRLAASDRQEVVYAAAVPALATMRGSLEQACSP